MDLELDGGQVRDKTLVTGFVLPCQYRTLHWAPFCVSLSGLEDRKVLVINPNELLKSWTLRFVREERSMGL